MSEFQFRLPSGLYSHLQWALVSSHDGAAVAAGPLAPHPAPWQLLGQPVGVWCYWLGVEAGRQCPCSSWRAQGQRRWLGRAQATAGRWRGIQARAIAGRSTLAAAVLVVLAWRRCSLACGWTTSCAGTKVAAPCVHTPGCCPAQPGTHVGEARQALQETLLTGAGMWRDDRGWSGAEERE